MTESDLEKKFKKIIDTAPPDTELYAGRGRKTIKVSKSNLKKLYSDVQKWSNKSFEGLVCGIYGCQEEPKNKCPICNGSYCLEHIKIHFHQKGNNGLVLRDVLID